MSELLRKPERHDNARSYLKPVDLSMGFETCSQFIQPSEQNSVRPSVDYMKKPGEQSSRKFLNFIYFLSFQLLTAFWKALTKDLALRVYTQELPLVKLIT